MSNPVVRAAAIFYAWLFRGTPVLLQLLLWYNLALIFPYIGPRAWFHLRTVDVMTPLFASLLGLGLNQGAYVSEIVRAGLLSVDAGQYEAAKSIGMTFSMALRRIILPQAMRDNASHMEKLVTEKRKLPPEKTTAVDDLKTYQDFTEARLDGLKHLTSAFKTLYDGMTPEQKKNADVVFEKYTPQSPPKQG